MPKPSLDESALLAMALEQQLIEATEAIELLMASYECEASVEDLLISRGHITAKRLSTLQRETESTSCLTPSRRGRDSQSRANKSRRSARSRNSDPSSRPSTVDGQPIDQAIPKAETDSRYEWTEEIASGGLGAVWSAYDPVLERTIAAKELLPFALKSAKMIDRFYTEARITSQLDHPGIVSVYDMGLRDDGSPFYLMQLLRGTTWSEEIERHHNRADRDRKQLAFHGLLNTFVDVCNTIGFAHDKHVVHRDLKPENVMVGQFGETIVVDWGLAKKIDNMSAERTEAGTPDTPDASPVDPSHPNRTCAGEVVGTPSFMSPEQARGKLSLDARSDVFSLGVILYEIITGHSPFRADDLATTLRNVKNCDFAPPQSINQQTPRPLAAICCKALCMRPADRFENAKQLGDEVRAWLAGETVACYEENAVERCLRWVRHHQSFATAIVGSLATITVVSLVALLGVRAAQKSESIARMAAESARDNAVVAQQQERNAKESALQMLSDGLEAADAMLIKESHILQFYPGLEENRRRLLEQADQSYTRFAAADLNDAMVKFAAAKSYIRAGDARQLLGRNEAARKAFAEANRVLTNIESPRISARDLELQVANSWIGLGMSRTAGQRNEIDEAFSNAVAILTRQLRQHPDDNEVLFARCRAQIAWARSIKTDSPERADELLRIANRDLSDLPGAKDPSSRYAQLLVSSYSELGRLARDRGELDSALLHFQQVVAHSTESIEQNGRLPDSYESRMVHNILIGNIHRERKQDNQAKTHYEAAVRDFNGLLEALFRGQYHSENLSVAMVNLSQIQLNQGDTTNGIGTLEEAQHEFLQLIRIHGELPRLIRQVADTTLALANGYRSVGESDDAVLAFGQTISVYERLAVIATDAPDRDRRQLAVAYVQLAETVYSMGDVEQAIKHLECVQSLTREGCQDEATNILAATADSMRADIYCQLDRVADATPLYLSALQRLDECNSREAKVHKMLLHAMRQDDQRSADEAYNLASQLSETSTSAGEHLAFAIAYFYADKFEDCKRELRVTSESPNSENRQIQLLKSLVEFRTASDDSSDDSSDVVDVENLDYENQPTDPRWLSVRLRNEFSQSKQQLAPQ